MQYKSIDYYLNLPWTYTVQTEDAHDIRYYIVEVNELPGVVTDAPTVAEAMEGIKEVMTAIFELYQEQGEPIPEPSYATKDQCTIVYLTTDARYSRITQEARPRNITMNQLLDLCVDQNLGVQSTPANSPKKYPST